MLLLLILTIITFRTLPELNKKLNETILANYPTTKIETKMNYVIYTRIAVVALLLNGLVLMQDLVSSFSSLSFFSSLSNYILSTFGFANLYAIFIFTISVIFIHFSNKNVFGLTLKRLTYFNSLTERLLVLFIIAFLSCFIIEAIYDFINRYQGNQFDSENKFSDGITNLSNEAQSVTKAAKEAWDQVNKNNILDLEWLTKSLNKFYSQLGLGQTLAAVNLSGCLVVIVSMISIIIVLYSDTLIEKYKIVERYPRLTNIIEIRRKFQKYYLIWDISVILGVLIIMVSLNIWFIFT